MPGPSAFSNVRVGFLFMPITYEKPHLSTEEQVALLEKRGMDVGERKLSEAALKRIGYYHLSEYWHPMRESRVDTDDREKPVTTVLDTFKVGARFVDAFELYVFDKRLRLLVLDAIERVEVALRVDCAHNLGARDPYIHRDWRALDPDFIAQDHARWLARIDDAAVKSREDFIHAFRSQFLPPLPLWVSIECWDFGMLSYFIGGMRTPDKTSMAERFCLPRRDLLTSWVRAVTASETFVHTTGGSGTVYSLTALRRRKLVRTKSLNTWPAIHLHITGCILLLSRFTGSCAR